LYRLIFNRYRSFDIFFDCEYLKVRPDINNNIIRDDTLNLRKKKI